MSESKLSKQQQTELEAATFRRFLAHLGERKDVQNIDLMILAGFAETVCPNGTRPAPTNRDWKLGRIRLGRPFMA